MLNKIKISKFVKLVLGVSFLFIGFSLGSSTFADTTSSATMELTIVKYQLSDTQLHNSTLPQIPTGSALANNEAKDSSGNILTLMPGVKYQIDQVIPSNDGSNPFELAPNNHSQIITTDNDGQATIALPTGIYRVTELQGGAIQTPAAPVIVQLPMTLQNGQILDHVYLYPKSSVVAPQSVVTEPSGNEPSHLPQTSGDSRSLIPVYGLLALVIVVGAYGMIALKPKHYTK